MEGMGDVVMVKELKSLFICYQVGVESRTMRIFLFVFGLEVWN